MARQTGILKFQGPMGGLSFYHHKHYGWLVRQCNPVDRARIKNDPKFAGTRDMNAELGTVSTNAALLRNGVMEFLLDIAADRLDNRLMRFMCGIRKQDTSSLRGKRCVSVALGMDPSLLGGFEFHEKDTLWKYAGQDPVVDAAAGQVSLHAFIPQEVPTAATHVALAALRGRLDFNGKRRQLVISEELVLPLDGVERDISLLLEAPGLEIGFEVWGMRIVFLQEVNGVKFPLRVGAAKLLQSNGLSSPDAEDGIDVEELIGELPVDAQVGNYGLELIGRQRFLWSHLPLSLLKEGKLKTRLRSKGHKVSDRAESRSIANS